MSLAHGRPSPVHLRSRAPWLALSVLVLGALVLTGPAVAQRRLEQRIVAQVNEDAITSTDLQGRLQLALASSGLPDNQESRQRLLPQVLRLLIDETLQMQETKRLNITVSDGEIEQEVTDIARRNRLTLDQFREALDRSGVPFATLRQQVRASIAWQKLVQRRIRPTIQVGDDEINAYAERIKANAGKPEYLVSEIFLSVDKPETEQEVGQLAERLVQQIGGGANFTAVAAQFSQSAAAANGGDLGWIQQGQLEQPIDVALQQMRPGQFSRPLRGIGGYHILWMRDQRTVAAGDPGNVRISLAQLVIPVPAGTDGRAETQAAQQVAKEAASCPALQAASQRLPGANLAIIPPTRMAEIPAQLGSLVGGLTVGQPTQPLVTDVGIMLLMVCERSVPEGSLPPRDQIANSIGLERLDMLQRRYLRNLRRDAYVDVRS